MQFYNCPSFCATAQAILQSTSPCTLQETKSAVKDAPKTIEAPSQQPTSSGTTKEPTAAAEGAVGPAAAHIMASDPAYDSRHGLQDTLWSQMKPTAPRRPPTGIGGILFPGMIQSILSGVPARATTAPSMTCYNYGKGRHAMMEDGWCRQLLHKCFQVQHTMPTCTAEEAEPCPAAATAGCCCAEVIVVCCCLQMSICSGRTVRLAQQATSAAATSARIANVSLLAAQVPTAPCCTRVREHTS
jgi:hypothetical protein